MSTCSAIETRLRVMAIMPPLGVTPPSGKLLHSSMRCAPPCSEAIADSTESTQTSTRTSQGKSGASLFLNRLRGNASLHQGPTLSGSGHFPIEWRGRQRDVHVLTRAHIARATL